MNQKRKETNHTCNKHLNVSPLGWHCWYAPVYFLNTGSISPYSENELKKG